ncbi:nudix hydrolase 15, mitochondrial-like [Melia azedarach]|uniref:Nudix hydrolase 15, mitochondrial-like n=1 Tax=Melia azedarach TaxID=155640 RepID=A0ACC1WXF6_MELAZ|nr:nudix hydrolase 15, mitochondrial-like [Melia azedarach]
MQRLVVIAQHLRSYKPPSSSSGRREETAAGKVVSQVGFQESVTHFRNVEKVRIRKAAVLVCLFEGDNRDLRVILTKRTLRLPTREISLPGKKAEEGDKDNLETATREAKEEIGLDPSLVDIVTVLEPFLCEHLLSVVPVICILRNRKAFKPTLNPVLLTWGRLRNYECLIWFWMKTEELGRENGWERTASVVYQKPPAFPEEKLKFPRVVKGDTEEAKYSDSRKAVGNKSQEFFRFESGCKELVWFLMQDHLMSLSMLKNCPFVVKSLYSRTEPFLSMVFFFGWKC